MNPCIVAEQDQSGLLIIIQFSLSGAHSNKWWRFLRKRVDTGNKYMLHHMFITGLTTTGGNGFEGQETDPRNFCRKLKLSIQKET